MAVGQRQADAVARTDAPIGELPGQAVGPGVELGVGQAHRPAHDGFFTRQRVRHPLEEVPQVP